MAPAKIRQTAHFRRRKGENRLISLSRCLKLSLGEQNLRSRSTNDKGAYDLCPTLETPKHDTFVQLLGNHDYVPGINLDSLRLVRNKLS
jgi:hypothetical protein